MGLFENVLRFFRKEKPKAAPKKESVEDFWAAMMKRMLRDGEIIYQKVVRSKERLAIKIAMKGEIPPGWLSWLSGFWVCFITKSGGEIFYKVETAKQMGNWASLELIKRGFSPHREGMNLKKEKEEYFPSDIKDVQFINSGGKIVYQFSLKN